MDSGRDFDGKGNVAAGSAEARGDQSNMGVHKQKSVMGGLDGGVGEYKNGAAGGVGGDSMEVGRKRGRDER